MSFPMRSIGKTLLAINLVAMSIVMLLFAAGWPVRELAFPIDAMPSSRALFGAAAAIMFPLTAFAFRPNADQLLQIASASIILVAVSVFLLGGSRGLLFTSTFLCFLSILPLQLANVEEKKARAKGTSASNRTEASLPVDDGSEKLRASFLAGEALVTGHAPPPDLDPTTDEAVPTQTSTQTPTNPPTLDPTAMLESSASELQRPSEAGADVLLQLPPPDPATTAEDPTADKGSSEADEIRTKILEADRVAEEERQAMLDLRLQRMLSGMETPPAQD